MDASDWTRIRKLNGARGNMYVAYGPVSPAPPALLTGITNPSPRTELESGRRVYTEFGTSKIRRPASNYTDYVASQSADYVMETTSGACGVGKNLTINKICKCATSSAKKVGLCPECKS